MILHVWAKVLLPMQIFSTKRNNSQDCIVVKIKLLKIYSVISVEAHHILPYCVTFVVVIRCYNSGIALAVWADCFTIGSKNPPSCVYEY